MVAALASSSRPGMQQKRLQRRWITLLEHFSATGGSDEMDQITHLSQVLCKSVTDRDWLIVAFQMAVAAVLLQPGVSEDARQLGQQLLQLAIHSICTPYLQHITDASKRDHVQQDLASFQLLERRLSLYESLAAVLKERAIKPVPLDLVLSQNTPTLFSLLASLPQGGQLISSLLQRLPHLVEESASTRLALLLLLVRSTNAQTLAESRLLVTWKNGKEDSIWASTLSSDQDLQSLTNFYAGQVESLCQAGCDDQAKALCRALQSSFEGELAQQAIQRILASLPSTSNQAPRQSEADTSSIQALARSIPALPASSEVRTQAVRSTIAHPAFSPATLVTLIDIQDAADVRAHILAVTDQPSTQALASQLPALFIAVLYARPASRKFRIDLNCPSPLLDSFAATASKLGTVQSAGPTATALNTLIRSALDVDRDCVVPACQLFALTESSMQQASLHIRWLTSLTRLMQGVDPRPSTIDACWLAAYGGPGSSEKQQQDAINELIEAFASTFPASRSDRGGFDVASLRIKGAWTTFFHDATALSDADGPFAALTMQGAAELLLAGVLRTGDVELFKTLSAEVSQTHSPEQLDSLVLKVSIELYDKATVGSMRNKYMKLANDVLDAAQMADSRIEAQREFIEATCRLCSFKVKSRLHTGQLLEPREIRTTKDRLDFIARFLAAQEDAYRSPELVLDIATKLSHDLEQEALSSIQRTLVEIRTLAMLADSATSSGEDFDQAAAFCHRLVDKVAILRTRGASQPEVVAMALDIGWKSCYQLSKQPEWDDTPSRVTMLANALTLCPAEQLPSLLRQWSTLDTLLVQELQEGKTYASTKRAAAGWLDINATDAVSGASSHLTAQNAAATAASVGAGLVGMGANAAANLLPLSFKPLAYFGSPQQNSAAKLFDHHTTGPDPTERAVRAARAARDFLGWKGSQTTTDGQQQNDAGQSGGAGFSLSKGVGWLIGEHKN